VDRIGRVRREHDVAGRGDRGGQTRKPLLRSHRHDHFGFGIDVDPKPATIVIRLGLAQTGDTLRLRIAVRAGFPRDFDELLDDVLGRRQVGIAHAEIDDVLPARARRRPHRVHFGDDVRLMR
jgi:hypothetical protein